MASRCFGVSPPKAILGRSLRNVNSWFGVYFPRQVGKGQVANFGPYRPVSVGRWRKQLEKIVQIEDEWGVSPLLSCIGLRINGLMTRYSRIWVVRIRKVE